MLYLHDTWVNWSFGGHRSYHTPEFFEWRKEDKPSIIDQVPLLLVEYDFYEAIDGGYPTIPQYVLDKVKDRTFLRKDQEREKINHAFLMSDGNRAMAVYTEGTTEPVCKSKLIPRQHRLALEMVRDTTVNKFPVPEEAEPIPDNTFLGKITNVKPEHMRGLTRTEREMKEILLDCLFTLGCSTNEHEVRYWYTEMFPNRYNDDLHKLSIENMISNMFDHVKYGWEDTHVQFGNNIVKHSDIYSMLWEELKIKDVAKNKGKATKKSK
jgi:hypothetical protein